MDRYDARIEELKAAQFEIGGLVAPLAFDAPERGWYERRAARIARELSMLYDSADTLRELDEHIEQVAGEINAEQARHDGRCARWRHLAVGCGVLASPLLLIAGHTPLWLTFLAFVLVAGGVRAAVQSSRCRREPNGTILAWGEELESLEGQQRAIWEGFQSPSASSPASAPDPDSTSSHSSTLVIPIPSL